ncbi:ferrochelatase [Pseudoduganella sp. GCM10020061]|uniref:ferrochelatase n=1 Tax=Pseudoduganella sp. GCM10020061 TaxID=3317345 RepID=UPI003633C790
MAFSSEPTFTHGAEQRTAIVLVNLGTPDAPTPKAVRRYLKEFLSDPRVVEIPRAIWSLILNLVILPFRSGQSAKKYESVWTRDGSPLMVHTQKQAMLLRGLLGERGHRVEVAMAMRYGSPSIPEVLDKLKADNCTRIAILPAYPQYSGTTTASVADAVFDHYRKVRNLPELRIVRGYHDHDAYIAALAASVEAHWEANGRAQKLVMSFHGVPKRTLLLGDPYHCECHKTARLLAQRLRLQPDQYIVTFQSRFGKAEWLQPYTQPTLEQLARDGVRSVDVMCPGFVADCLETLEEIDMEVRHAFMAAGGEKFSYIPCLNESKEWIAALAEIAEQHLVGWPTVQSNTAREAARAELELGREKAVSMGALQ